MKALFLNPVPLIFRGIMPGFQQNGWETFLCEGDEFFLGKPPKEQYVVLNSCIKKYNPDMVFLDFGFGPDFDTIYKCCKDNNVLFVVFGIEDIPSDKQWMQQVINKCDIYLTTTEEFIPLIKNEYDKDAFLFTFGVPSFPYEAEIKPEYERDIVFVGNNYASRYDDFEDYIYPMITQKRDIRIWGNEWWLDEKFPVNLCQYPNTYNGYFSFDELNSLYSSAKIGLGLNCNKESRTQTSMRPCEVMSVGRALYVAPWSPAQENLFGKSGKYCFLPKTPKEMFDCIDNVLEMSKDDRFGVAQRAQKMVYKKHDYKDKIANLLKSIGMG